MDGFFGYPRELLGVKNLLTLFYDDPALMHRIIGDHLELLLALYEPVIRDLRPDFAFIWEDMCYKNGPLISPHTFREFMLPAYQTLTRFLKQMGVKIIIVDSDGNVDKLIPLWLEGGVTGLLPFEVKAGGDVLKVRKQYPAAADHWWDRQASPGRRPLRNRRRARARPARDAGAWRLWRCPGSLGA